MTSIADEYPFFPKWPEEDCFSEDEYLQALSAGGPYEDTSSVSPELRPVLEAQFDEIMRKYFPNRQEQVRK